MFVITENGHLSSVGFRQFNAHDLLRGVACLSLSSPHHISPGGAGFTTGLASRRGVVYVAADTRIVSAADGVRERAPAIVSVRGPVNVAAGTRLLLELNRLMVAGVERCVVDLSHATSFGATGLAALLTTQRRASALGGWVHLVKPPTAVLEYLTGSLSPLPFTVYDSVEDATG